jgi:hypothetical protein
MSVNNHYHYTILQNLAHRTMIERKMVRAR